MKRLISLLAFLLLAVACLAQSSPTLYEKWTPPNGTSSQAGSSGLLTYDNLFQVDGLWIGTGGASITPGLATFTTADPTSYNGPPTGYLELQIGVNGTGACANTLCGSEVINNYIASSTVAGNGYGYYEALMAADTNHVTPGGGGGGVVSFFLKAAGGTLASKDYGAQEFDFEFVLGAGPPNFTWTNGSGSTGYVALTAQGDGTSYYNLPFNPSNGYHRYGLLWTHGSPHDTVRWYADGVLLKTDSSANTDMPTAANGRGYDCTGSTLAGGSCGMWIFANAWDGNAAYGGGPPTTPIQSQYNFFKYWPNVTSVPVEGPYSPWPNFPQANTFFPLGVFEEKPQVNITGGSTTVAANVKAIQANIMYTIDGGSGGYGYPGSCNTDTNSSFAALVGQGLYLIPIVNPLGWVTTNGSTTASTPSLYPLPIGSSGTIYVGGVANTLTGSTSTGFTTGSTQPNDGALTWWEFLFNTSGCNSGAGPFATQNSLITMAGANSSYIAGYSMGDEPQGGPNGCGQLVTNIPNYMDTVAVPGCSAASGMLGCDQSRPFLWNHTNWPFLHGSCSGSLNQAANKVNSIGSFDSYAMALGGLSGTQLDSNGWGDFMWIPGWALNQFLVNSSTGQPMWVWGDDGANDETSNCGTPVGNTCSGTGTTGDPHPYRATPEQVNAEAWANVINGALGLGWFCHDSTAEDYCLSTSTVASNLTYVDGALLGFAAVIQSTTLDACTMNTGASYANYTTSCAGANGILTMTAGTSTVPGSALLKSYGGTLYLFADNDRNLPSGSRTSGVTQTFKIGSAYSGYKATVVYDSNAQYDPTHSSVGTVFTLNGSGQFSDTFGANDHEYQPKIYSIALTSTQNSAPATAIFLAKQ
jgi:Glycosyl hydrolases family 16